MEKLLKKIVWLMGGLLLAYVAVATAATGSFQTDCFYGGGEMDEILPLTLQGEWPGLSYQNPNDAFFTVTEDNAYESLVITKKKWKYVAIDISHLNSDTLTLHLMACDEAWNAIEAQTIEAKNGKEIFTYNLPKCKNLIVSIPNQKGKQFRFNSLQFRKKLVLFNRRNAAAAGIVVIFSYAAFTIVIVVLKKKRKIDILLPFRRAGERCVMCYFWYVEKAAGVIYVCKNRLSGRDCAAFGSALRIISLAAWILAEIFMRGYGLRTEVIPFHYLAAAVVMFLFCITTVKQRPQKPFWNHPLIYAWFWLSVIMTLSGIFVQKKWPGIGLLYLFVYAVWFYIWGNSKKPYRILADISYALKIVFWITTIISVFARTYIPRMAYSGIYKNQNVFVSFLIMILAIDLSQVKNMFLKKERNVTLWMCLSLELSLILFFLLGTKSRGGLLTGMIVILLWMAHLLRGGSANRKRAVFFMLQTAVLLFPVSYAAEHTFLYVQSAVPARIEYAAANPEDERILDDTYTGGEPVYAEENEGTQMVSAIPRKSLDGLTSGRITLWKSYIRKMNLWGHFNKEIINGVATHSHNAFMYTAYLYGILALIPYFVMWCTIFSRGRRYAKTAVPYSFMPLALTAGFFVQAMTDTLEEPFSVESWIIVYIVIGILFSLDSEKGEV
ncbi:MAG: hypothetical protein HFI82_01775 [Eubacterium sp.]|jgi:hypothetical protein|nr:hypothetical protein [Eubacterium sp.]